MRIGIYKPKFPEEAMRKAFNEAAADLWDSDS
jgi:hypothetical protein